jgi:hypothetical protein
MRVWGKGLEIQGSELGVQGFGLTSGSRFQVLGFGFQCWVQKIEFQVSGVDIRVQSSEFTL